MAISSNRTEDALYSHVFVKESGDRYGYLAGFAVDGSGDVVVVGTWEDLQCMSSVCVQNSKRWSVWGQGHFHVVWVYHLTLHHRTSNVDVQVPT